MYCTACGNRIPNEAVYCTQCGKQRQVYTKPEFSEYIGSYKLRYTYEDVIIAYSNNFNTGFVNFGDALKLQPDPTNEFDNKAVAVYHYDSKIGYLPKKKFQEMFYDFINRNDAVSAVLSKKEGNNLFMNIGFYVDEEQERERKAFYRTLKDTKVFKLTSVGKEEIQENIFLCSIGEEVDIEYDYERDKYIVLDLHGNELGTLPTSSYDMIDRKELTNPIIEVIEEDNNGKLSIKVSFEITKQDKL